MVDLDATTLNRAPSVGTMSLEGDGNLDDLHGEGGETNKRSERKRQREKQRRTDLTNAFDELAAFIFQIEPEAGDPDVDAKKKRKKSGSGPQRNDHGEESSGITRLDLIGRALRIMKRLHRENEERKRMIEHMRERRSGQQSNDNVSAMFSLSIERTSGTAILNFLKLCDSLKMELA